MRPNLFMKHALANFLLIFSDWRGQLRLPGPGRTLVSFLLPVLLTCLPDFACSVLFDNTLSSGAYLRTKHAVLEEPSTHGSLLTQQTFIDPRPNPYYCLPHNIESFRPQRPVAKRR